MTSLFAVLTTEYLRRLRFPWLMIVLGFVGSPLAFLGLLWLYGLKVSPGEFHPYDYNALYMAIALLILPLLTLSIQWQIYPHLYARPISTRALAVWLMVTGVATIAGTHVLVLLAYRLLLGAAWPILAPMLFFMTFTLLAQCIHWNLLKLSPFKLLGGFAVIAGAGWWFALRYHPEGFYKPMQPWLNPSAVELATMLAASLAAVLLGIRGLSLARHESAGNMNSSEAYDLADPFVSTQVPRLIEIPQALNWFFWRRGLPFAVGAAGVVVLYMGLLFVLVRNDLHQSERVLETLAGMSFFFPLLVCIVVGVALGLDVRHPVQHILMPFLSTRPLTTRQLSRSLLWNAFKSTLTAWGILILALVLFGTGFFLKVSPAELLSELRATKLGIAAIPLVLGGSLLACWTGLSWMAVLGWSGREKVLLAGVFLLIGLPLLFLLFVQFVVPAGWANFVKGVGLWLPAILIPIMTIDLTVAARRGSLLSHETPFLLVALAVCIIAFFGVLLPISPTGKVLVCLYSLASLLPIPVAPLMLEWNRHR